MALHTPDCTSIPGCTADDTVAGSKGTLVLLLEAWHTEGGMVPDGADKMEDACGNGKTFLGGPIGG